VEEEEKNPIYLSTDNHKLSLSLVSPHLFHYFDSTAPNVALISSCRNSFCINFCSEFSGKTTECSQSVSSTKNETPRH